MIKVPKTIPEKGYYYHYKHDPKGDVNNYAYEVIGVGCHTEDDCREQDQNLMVYRPLYKSSVYEAGRLFDIRPLEMWMEDVEVDGVSVPRFKLITDEEVIAQLDDIRTDMYY